MQIDWFTLIAQIVNFLILLFLLHRLLFRPVMGIMERREQNINDRMAEADDKRQQAEKKAEEYRLRRSQLEEEREQLLKDAHEEAEEIKKRAERAAKEEVEQLRRQWEQSLERQKDDFLAQLRHDVGRQVCHTSRAVLRNLADSDLEAQIVDRFNRRLGDLDDHQRKEITASANGNDARMTIITAFDLSDALKNKIRDTLADILGDASKPEFAIDSELICGIELRSNGHSIRWDIDQYINDVEDHFVNTVKSATATGKQAVSTADEDEDEND